MTETWLQDWYGVEHQPMMTNGMMRSMQHVERLEGADYEIAFMRSTIRHHWGALRGRDVSGARRAGGASPSARTSSPQLEEIAQMQAWLSGGYGVTGGRPVENVA